MARRIILLSDGTGNSSAKIWRTNVWRTFEALDLSGSNQVAFYDDGVGTSSFKLWAILGGAFGFGLKRNIIDIYKFACRNYRSDSDEIFGFGFSRGAFTIRVVIGLILDQGLVPAGAIDDAELDKRARQAYRAYRKKRFHTNWGIALRALKGGRNPIQPSPNPVPIVRFLGLWDTVAAYGLPVDEMTRGVSQWIKPLEIPSHELHLSVMRACHALAIDDERMTFHPVLWDEPYPSTLPDSPRYTKDERISQVWFAGMHANVGGGYPDDSLAKISLYWIMEEAKRCGLIFKEPPAADPNALAQTRSAQDKDGRLYNSRAGLSSYYRYGPRDIERLCDETFSRTPGDEVRIVLPKIHESVLKRIGNNAHVYAPIGLPQRYEVLSNVEVHGERLFEIRSPDSIETPTDAKARVHRQRVDIDNLVLARTFVYFVIVIVSFFSFIFPLNGRPDPIGEATSDFRSVSDVIRLIGSALPNFTRRWIEGYAQHPKTFVEFAIALTILIKINSKLASRITNGMWRVWKEVQNHDVRDPGPPEAHWGYRLRKKLLLPLVTVWKFYVAPAVSALAIFCVVLAFSSHALFNVLDVRGHTCIDTPGKINYVPDKGALISFHSSELCHASTLKVHRGAKYLVSVNPGAEELAHYPGYTALPSAPCDSRPVEVLADGDRTTTLSGYATFENVIENLSHTITHFFLLPLRRELDRPWFQLVLRYGRVGGEEGFVDPDPDPTVTELSTEIRPPVERELFMFVNDAVIGVPHWFDAFYRDNKGCIRVLIKPR